jgi:hypothetical protein
VGRPDQGSQRAGLISSLDHTGACGQNQVEGGQDLRQVVADDPGRISNIGERDARLRSEGNRLRHGRNRAECQE